MTHYTRADLEMADRHIEEGERHIVNQEILITKLRLQDLPVEEAEALLAILNSTQVEHHATPKRTAFPRRRPTARLGVDPELSIARSDQDRCDVRPCTGL